ncbi:pentapeptide repeat-containing protein [Actinoplanes sp. NPDC051470]|uniref:pentapeptide repeat-containing protein n=1 Tax=Actinoplanes sp. NPDC051470 TaxID=3157224 RepID=UPI00342BFB59
MARKPLSTHLRRIYGVARKPRPTHLGRTRHLGWSCSTHLRRVRRVARQFRPTRLGRVRRAAQRSRATHFGRAQDQRRRVGRARVHTEPGRPSAEEARVRGARLRDARLRDARIRGARLRDARLRGARLGDAGFRSTCLGGLGLWGGCGRRGWRAAWARLAAEDERAGGRDHGGSG